MLDENVTISAGGFLFSLLTIIPSAATAAGRIIEIFMCRTSVHKNIMLCAKRSPLDIGSSNALYPR
ncbi:hypothetical protein ACMD2_10326 [Ananas comosus]|uniref:Uncharacterized protein n=1 Tax=Ananas comosus TaxID=4615 RepID=A0A199UE08_ANACO|nr:hypothetical protein ACMD2_10326 [Ananas comosus]